MEPVDAALIADAEAPPRVVPPLAEPMDGLWDFTERCAGVETTYTLDVKGPLADFVADRVRQPVELADAREKDGRVVGALAIPLGGGPPLFRLLRTGAALSRWSLGNDATQYDLTSTGDVGTFHPRCTTFAAFIAREELDAQAWKRISFEGIGISYPSRVFPTPMPLPKKKMIFFGAENVFGSDMAGNRATFSVTLRIDKRTPSAAMKAMHPGDRPDSDPDGPMIAGARGIEVQRGVEGVGQHLVAVRLGNGSTLAVEIAWVSAFANEKIEMSDAMQLAIAARMMASIDYDTRP